MASLRAGFCAVRVHRFGDPSVLQVDRAASLPSGAPLGPRQVLIRVAAAGVNPVDTYIRAGAYASLPALPFTPGKDGAGTVEAVGAAVTAVRVGDRVACFGSETGTYAAFAVCRDEHLIPLPARLDMPQGAALGIPFMTAHRALFQMGRARAGETVLIHGASGGVGTAAVQLARHRGMRVIGTAGSPQGRALVAQLGAHAVVDHTEKDYEDDIRRHAGDAGIDLIIENAAHVNLDRDTRIIGRRGRIIVIGSRGETAITPRALMASEASIAGMMLFLASEQEMRETREDLARILQETKIAPIVAEILPLEEAARAHERIIGEGEVKKTGKFVLCIP